MPKATVCQEGTGIGTQSVFCPELTLCTMILSWVWTTGAIPRARWAAPLPPLIWCEGWAEGHLELDFGPSHHPQLLPASLSLIPSPTIPNPEILKLSLSGHQSSWSWRGAFPTITPTLQAFLSSERNTSGNIFSVIVFLW